jgi:pimeloyl-ACP methyl ester carboxylesterase
MSSAPHPNRKAPGSGRPRSRLAGPWRAAGLTVAVAALGAGVLTATASAAISPVTHGSDPAKPTIVLVHGAWADGSSWSGEVHRLQRQGYPVDVAPNPLRGVATDSAYLADYLSTISGPIVLVGHSYGGMVITNAATGNADVKALVYVDAFIPDEGESIGALTNGSGSILEPALADPSAVFTLRPFPGAPQDVGDSYVLPELFLNGFAPDLPRDEGQALAASQQPLATNAVSELSGVPAWKTIPSWSLIGTADKVIPAAGQEAMAHRAGAHIVTVNGSHLSLISHAREVSDLIVTAANATR